MQLYLCTETVCGQYRHIHEYLVILNTKLFFIVVKLRNFTLIHTICVYFVSLLKCQRMDLLL